MAPPSADKIQVTVRVKDPDQLIENLHLLVGQAKRVERSARILKQSAARLRDSIAVEPSTAQEAHDNGSIRDPDD